MVSSALTEWRSSRAARIDELLAAHTRIGGTGMGRRYRTEQLNWSIALRTAAEFQGFARDLHNLAVDDLAARIATHSVPSAAITRRLLTNGRRIDSGNPNAGNLGSDFGRLGLDLWPVLRVRYPNWTPLCQRHLDALMRARNGIAHADDTALRRMDSEGYPLRQLKTMRSWRGWISRLAAMMDATTAHHLSTTFGGPLPW